LSSLFYPKLDKDGQDDLTGKGKKTEEGEKKRALTRMADWAKEGALGQDGLSPKGKAKEQEEEGQAAPP